LSHGCGVDVSFSGELLNKHLLGAVVLIALSAARRALSTLLLVRAI